MKYRMRIAAVDSAPTPATIRDLAAGTDTHALIQKKMYGISVVMTAMLASRSNRLVKKRSPALAPQLTIRETTGVPRLPRRERYGREYRDEIV